MAIKYVRAGLIGMLMVGAAALGPVATASQPATTMKAALEFRIATEMRMPANMNPKRADGYIARVAFTVDAQGRTQDVIISRGSGSDSVDHEAVRMVSSFHGLPSGRDGKQIFAVLQYRDQGEVEDAVPKTMMATQVALAKTDSNSALRLAKSDSSPIAALAAVATVDQVSLWH